MDDAFIPIFTKIMVKHLSHKAYPTDKFLNGYMDKYFDLAQEIGPDGVICEIGVDRGGSLMIWDDLFPDGKIVGVDANPNAHWPNGFTRVVMDQTDENLRFHLIDWMRQNGSADLFFDLIIDDASHIGTATEKTFFNLWPLVKPGRWYVVEDWGVGFPGAPMYDQSMSEFVAKLPAYMGSRLMDIHTIEYRHGMIIIAKKM